MKKARKKNKLAVKLGRLGGLATKNKFKTEEEAKLFYKKISNDYRSKQKNGLTEPQSFPQDND